MTHSRCVVGSIDVCMHAKILMRVAEPIVADIAAKDEQIARLQVHNGPLALKRPDAQARPLLDREDGRERHVLDTAPALLRHILGQVLARLVRVRHLISLLRRLRVALLNVAWRWQALEPVHLADHLLVLRALKVAALAQNVGLERLDKLNPMRSAPVIYRLLPPWIAFTARSTRQALFMTLGILDLLDKVRIDRDCTLADLVASRVQLHLSTHMRAHDSSAVASRHVFENRLQDT